MSGRNAVPHRITAVLISKPHTAQLGHGSNDGAHVVVWLLGSWLVSQLHWWLHTRHH